MSHAPRPDLYTAANLVMVQHEGAEGGLHTRIRHRAVLLRLLGSAEGVLGCAVFVSRMGAPLEHSVPLLDLGFEFESDRGHCREQLQRWNEMAGSGGGAPASGAGRRLVRYVKVRSKRRCRRGRCRDDSSEPGPQLKSRPSKVADHGQARGDGSEALRQTGRQGVPGPWNRLQEDALLIARTQKIREKAMWVSLSCG